MHNNHELTTAVNPTRTKSRFGVGGSIRHVRMLFAIFFVLLPFAFALAQESPDTGVWVTTQDNSSLRAGPGEEFERLTIVPAGTTLPATRRTPNNDWLQVYYDGQYGWIAYWLLIWTGDLNSLPVEGAVEQTPETGIYVTTQDNSSLRRGPGRGFERITVVPAAVTLPAVGRSADGRWIQVYYDGQYGWIAYWLLVWSGDIVSLPIDGVNPAPFVRRTGVQAITVRETAIYRREVTPSDQVGTIPAGTTVEVTARLGSTGYYQLQIFYQGQVYWVGSWDLRIVAGNVGRLLDTSYLYAYGRLVTNVTRDINDGIRGLNAIESIWRALGNGQPVSCDNLPRYVTRRRVTDVDVAREPIFAPVVEALDTAIGHTNTAISMFEDACAREDGFITQQDVNTALNEIDSARRNFNLSGSLLATLRQRDPLLNRNQ